jgi:hypothetical protein
MNTDKTPDTSRARSYTLVIVVAFVIAVLMPVVRALAIGDTEVAAAYTTATASATAGHSALPAGGADTLSLLVVGAFLLGLGSVLRRVA